MRRCIKSFVEWLLALLMLLLAAPLMLAIALLVLAADGPPVLHREPRVGRHGRCFGMLKFRTLRPGAGPGIAPVDDSRIFPTAARLRSWRLDELPQLLHVLRGDMALVGPRPLPPRHADSLAPRLRQRLCSVRPGITGPSALAFLGDDEALRGTEDAEARYIADLLPEKVALDIDYLENWSLSGDCGLLLGTLRQLASPAARAASRQRAARILEQAASVRRQ